MSEPSIMEQVRFFTHPKPQSMTVEVAAIAKALSEAVEVLKYYSHQKHYEQITTWHRPSLLTEGGQKARDFLRKIGAGE